MMMIFYMIVLLMSGLAIFVFMILVAINNDIRTGSWLDNPPKEKYKKSRPNYIPETIRIPTTNHPIYFRRRNEPSKQDIFRNLSTRGPNVLLQCSSPQ